MMQEKKGAYDEYMELREKAMKKNADPGSAENSSTDDDSIANENGIGGRDYGAMDKIDPNHWVVHGKKFDLREFMAKHPGGQHSISFGRGRDCTLLVESYHPYSDKVW